MSCTGDVSLNAATATGVGTTISFDCPKSNVSMQVVLTGSPTTVSVPLEGTVDGVTFIQLVLFNQGSGNNAIVASSGKPVVAVRANLTVLTGGTSPTVTATISATD